MIAGARMARWSLERLKDRMDKYKTSEYDWNVLKEPLSTLQKAAVLVPLTIVDGNLHVWLTKRSDKVGNDKGHVSFPGGMKEPADIDAVSTALRESEEEISLRGEHVVSVLGTIPPWINIRNTLITPVVALVSDQFSPDANEEVEFAFQMPLEKFLSTDVHWHSVIPRKGSMGNRFLHFFRYSDSSGHEAVTFGLTASMCIVVSCALLGRSPDFQYSPTFQIDSSNPFRSQVEYIRTFRPELNELPTEFREAEQSKL